MNPIQASIAALFSPHRELYTKNWNFCTHFVLINFFFLEKKIDFWTKRNIIINK